MQITQESRQVTKYIQGPKDSNIAFEEIQTKEHT